MHTFLGTRRYKLHTVLARAHARNTPYTPGTQTAGTNTKAVEESQCTGVAGSMRLITQLDSLVDAVQTLVRRVAPASRWLLIFQGNAVWGIKSERIENASITGQGRMFSSARLLPGCARSSGASVKGCEFMQGRRGSCAPRLAFLRLNSIFAPF